METKDLIAMATQLAVALIAGMIRLIGFMRLQQVGVRVTVTAE